MFVIDDVYRILKDEKKSCIMVTHDIEEAVSFSDKIIILSNKPTIVKKEIETNLKNNKPSLKRREKEFNDICFMIYESVDSNV